MKKLAYILPLLVVIAAVVFLLVHRQEKTQHVNREIKAESATHFTFAEQLALARAACGTGQVTVGSKKEILCSVCPSGSDFQETAGMPGSGTGWTLDGALPGSFTAKGADEALLHATGCESHANSFGGNFLMRRTGDDWSTIRYASGGTANDKCQKLPWPTGREALVCESTDMHQGVASDAVQLLLFDEKAPAQPDTFENTFFLGVTDESANCGFEAGTHAKPHTMQLAKIDSFDVLPEAPDGNRNVAVNATINRVPSPMKPGAACPAGQPHIYRLVFDNQGDHFDAGEGYIPLHALKREDCCELTMSPKVRPGRY